MKHVRWLVLIVAATAAASLLTGCGIGIGSSGSHKTPEYTLTIAVSDRVAGDKNTGPAGTVKPASDSKFKEGTVVTLTATPAETYYFDDWGGPDGELVVDDKIVMTKDMSVKALFTRDLIIKYLLTTGVSPAGSGTMTPLSGRKYNANTYVSLTATPSPGWVFSGWGGPDGASVADNKVFMDKNKSVIAVFKRPDERIVFSSDRTVEEGDLSNEQIFVMDPDGGNERQLTHDSDSNRDPVWSPDRTKIAFWANNYDPVLDGNWDIFVMSADGLGGRTRLTTDPFDDMYPTWSPDGNRIAFTSNRDTNGDGYRDAQGIYVMSASGAGQTRLADGAFPDWSPDGTKIVYCYSDGASWNLKVMNVDGSGGASLGTGIWPAWSPDGKKIAYTISGSPAQIGIMNADGSGKTVLTTGWTPAWSPDGTKIAYWGGSVSSEIFVINIDGTGQVQLTTNSFDDLSPDW